MSAIRQLTVQLKINSDSGGVHNADKAINKTINSTDKLNNKLKTLGRSYSLYVGLPATIALGYAVRSAVNFEDKMLDVQKVVNGLDTDEKLKGFGKGLEEMSRRIPLTRMQLAEMAESAGQANIALSEMESYIELAAQASVAFNMNSQDTGAALAQLKANLNLTIPELRNYLGLINVAGDSTNARESDIIDALVRTSSTAKSLGLAKEETLGYITTLLHMGVVPQRASTAFTNLITSAKQAQKPTETLNQAIIRIFDTITKTKDERARLNLLQGIFGKGEEAINIGKVISHLQSVKSGVVGVADVIKLLKDGSSSAGMALQTQFGKKVEDAKSQLILLRNELEIVAGQIGVEALPSLVSFSKHLSNILEKFSALPSSVKLTTLAMIGLAAALPAILAIVKSIAVVFAAITWEITLIIAVIAATGYALKKLLDVYNEDKEVKERMKAGRNFSSPQDAVTSMFDNTKSNNRSIMDSSSMFSFDRMLAIPQANNKNVVINQHNTNYNTFDGSRESFEKAKLQNANSSKQNVDLIKGMLLTP